MSRMTGKRDLFLVVVAASYTGTLRLLCAAILQGQTHLQHRLRRYVSALPLGIWRGQKKILQISDPTTGRIVCALGRPSAELITLCCKDENAKLTDCYYEKKDWRACKDEVSDANGSSQCSQHGELTQAATLRGQMERFRQCWKVQGNDKRTDTRDAEH